MTITATFREEKTIEKEVQLPYYCKDAGNDLYAVEDENTVIRVRPDGALIGITKSEMWLMKGDIATATQISAQEFEEAYHKTLEVLVGSVKQTA